MGPSCFGLQVFNAMFSLFWGQPERGSHSWLVQGFEEPGEILREKMQRIPRVRAPESQKDIVHVLGVSRGPPVLTSL